MAQANEQVKENAISNLTVAREQAKDVAKLMREAIKKFQQHDFWDARGNVKRAISELEAIKARLESI